MQIFPRTLNWLPLVLALVVFVGGGVATFVVAYYFAPANTHVGYAPEQPVPYSHKLHAGELGIDCRYCHSNVEQSAHAMIPSTQTCMGCHSLVRTDSAALAKVRDSWKTGESIPWVKIHRLPDHVYFDHSAHLSAGVACISCHGQVDQMEVVRQEQSLSMGWCLDCHRNPTPHLRSASEVTLMKPYKDLYEVLGVSKSATNEQIKQAYEALKSEAKEGALAEETSEAFKVLGDSRSREQYNLHGFAWKDVAAGKQRAVAPAEHCSACHR